MQRRAAAVYAAFLIVLAAGAYAAIGVAEEPTVTVENPDYTLSVGEAADIGDRTYTAATVGDGSGDLVWVNESARQTETWENGSTVAIGGTEFTVAVEPGEEPSSFALREVQPLGENVTTVEVDGAEFVVVDGDDERSLVPRDEYLRDQHGEPETRRLSVGDSLDYQNQTAEVSGVATDGVTVAWTEPAENTISVSEGSVVELGGQEYVAHFEGNAVQLSTDIAAYERQVELMTRFQERINGLWGVSILGSLAAILLLGMAYLPSRY